jgi:DNA-binding response OmpR family regulator
VIPTLANARTISPSQAPTSFPDASPRPQPRALIVAGEAPVARPLTTYLTRGGFATEVVPAGVPLLAEIGRNRPHVIFLCLAEDKGATLSSCAELRRSISTPTIVCSTSRELAPVVDALQAGADDYFVLPMQPLEFVSRVRAILRRVRRSRTSVPEQSSIVAGDLEVRPQDHRAYRNGEQLDLTPTEFRLLTVLVRNAGRTISHGKLLTQVWGAGYTDGGATLRIYIRRLRSKLGDDSLIASTHSIGYCFQPAVAVKSPAA